MNKIQEVLNKIYNEQVIQVGDNLKCEVCGREILVQEKGVGPLICCGKEMVRIGETVQEAGFEDKPKGWSDNSIKKFSKTFTKKMKGNVKSTGFFDKCVKKMQGKIDNPEGFCASLKDEAYGSTYWRGKDKKPGEVKKDVARNKNV
jgi:hypothetical protein